MLSDAIATARGEGITSAPRPVIVSSCACPVQPCPVWAEIQALPKDES